MISFPIIFQVMLVLQVLLSTDVLNFNFHVLLYADACKIPPLKSLVILFLWVHPLSPFHHPSCAVASQFGLGWSGMVSAALGQLVALILGACGVWCAKFVIYQ